MMKPLFAIVLFITLTVNLGFKFGICVAGDDVKPGSVKPPVSPEDWDGPKQSALADLNNVVCFLNFRIDEIIQSRERNNLLISIKPGPGCGNSIRIGRSYDVFFQKVIDDPNGTKEGLLMRGDWEVVQKFNPSPQTSGKYQWEEEVRSLFTRDILRLKNISITPFLKGGFIIGKIDQRKIGMNEFVPFYSLPSCWTEEQILAGSDKLKSRSDAFKVSDIKKNEKILREFSRDENPLMAFEAMRILINNGVLTDAEIDGILKADSGFHRQAMIAAIAMSGITKNTNSLDHLTGLLKDPAFKDQVEFSYDLAVGIRACMESIDNLLPKDSGETARSDCVKSLSLIKNELNNSKLDKHSVGFKKLKLILVFSAPAN